MEKTHRLRRQRAAMARTTATSESHRIQDEPAGRDSLRAAAR